MKCRKIRTLNKFLIERDLPRFSVVLFSLLFFAWISVLFRSFVGVTLASYEYLTGSIVPESIGTEIETQLVLAQSGAIPWSCLMLLVSSCLILNRTLFWKLMQVAASIVLAVNILQIMVNFTIHLINADNTSIHLFVARFIGLTIYVYVASIVVLVCRMKRVSKLEWKTLDITMLLFALFAFSGTVLQKITGPLELISALAVVAGTIAFAFKLARTTCELATIRNTPQT